MLTILDGGIRLHDLTTPDHVFDVVRTGCGWRLVEAYREVPDAYGRWWDYAVDDPIPVIMAAYAWRASGDREPAGWVRCRPAPEGRLRRRS